MVSLHEIKKEMLRRKLKKKIKENKEKKELLEIEREIMEANTLTDEEKKVEEGKNKAHNDRRDKIINTFKKVGGSLADVASTGVNNLFEEEKKKKGGKRR